MFSCGRYINYYRLNQVAVAVLIDTLQKNCALPMTLLAIAIHERILNVFCGVRLEFCLIKHCVCQRRQSDFKSGGSGIRVQKFRFFPTKFHKNLDFPNQISENLDFS